MKLFYIIVLLLTATLEANAAYSKTTLDEASVDAESFCKYFTEKSKAKIITLKMPDAIARFDNNLSDTRIQKNLVVGLSKDLADLSKAKQVNNLIQEECIYYQLNQEAQLQIQYAIPSIKLEALKYKLQQIQIAKNKLKKLLTVIKKRIDSQNDTLITYYNIESSLVKLEDSEREINVDLASQQLLNIKNTNLNELLKNLSIIQVRRQKTLDQLEKENNWSIRVEAGAQQDLANNHNKKVDPYLALLLRYNLGSIFSENQMNNSLNDYALWQEKQVAGTQNQLSKLILSLTALKTANEERLSYLRKNYQSHSKLSHTLKVSNSPQAIHFRQEVEIDTIMVEIEINHTKYIIKLLQAIT